MPDNADDIQQVKNLQTGDYDDVPLSDLEAGISAGTYAPPDTVAVRVGTDPTPRQMPWATYQRTKGTGLVSGASTQEAAEQAEDDAIHEENRGLGGLGKAAIGGALGGPTFGLVSPFEDAQSEYGVTSFLTGLAPLPFSALDIPKAIGYVGQAEKAVTGTVLHLGPRVDRAAMDAFRKVRPSMLGLGPAGAVDRSAMDAFRNARAAMLDSKTTASGVQQVAAMDGLLSSAPAQKAAKIVAQQADDLAKVAVKSVNQSRRPGLRAYTGGMLGKATKGIRAEDIAGDISRNAGGGPGEGPQSAPDVLAGHLNDHDSDFNAEANVGTPPGGLEDLRHELGITTRAALGGPATAEDLDRAIGLRTESREFGFREVAPEAPSAGMPHTDVGGPNSPYPEYPAASAPLVERLGQLSRTPADASLVDAVSARLTQVRSGQSVVNDLIERPALVAGTGFAEQDLRALYGRLNSERNQLGSLSKYSDAELPNLRNTMHANDVDMARLSEVTDRVPRGWADPAQRLAQARATEAAMKEVARLRAVGTQVSQAAEDARVIGAKLGLGRADAAAVSDGFMARAARWAGNRVLKAIPGGKYFGKLAGMGGAAGLTGLAVDHAIRHGVSAMLGHGALLAGGAAVGSAVLRRLAAHPEIGGLIVGNVANVLNNGARSPDQAPPHSTDAREALRDLSNRARSLSPQAVAGLAQRSLSHVAGSSPITVAKAGQVAAQRHSQLLQLLDREDPAATTTGARLMGRPLPSSSSARRVADFLRATVHPLAPLLMALDGRLGPTAMVHAQTVFPNAVARMRSHLTEALADVGTHGASPARQRTVETMLGPEALGGPGHGEFYRQTMRSLVSTATKPQPPQGKAPPPQPAGPIGTNPLATPAQRAANPAQGR